jgi:hypothetical protein
MRFTDILGCRRPAGVGAAALLVLTGVTATLAAPNCPPLGAVFPKPTNLLSSAVVKAAIANITATLEVRDKDNSTGAFDNSYGIEVFSATDSKETIFSWYHTAPSLAKSNTTGVRTVDADTVYRLGSLTKIFTIYTWLVQDGDTKWNEPITKYVPELAGREDLAKDDPLTNVNWEEVTIGALASQLAGVVRDCKLLPIPLPEVLNSDCPKHGGYSNGKICKRLTWRQTGYLETLRRR